MEKLGYTKGRHKFFVRLKSLFQYKRALALFALLIVFVSGTMLWNAASLQAAINRSTKSYVDDVTVQLANDIDYRLSRNILDLQVLADNIVQMNDSQSMGQLNTILERRTKPLGFSSIAVIGRDGRAYSTEPLPELAGLPGVQASFQGESGVSFLDQQSVLYSVPICWGDQVVGVLAGVRDKANMQELIRAKSFSGQNLACIIDQDGNVIISPENLDPFLRLDDIFMKKSDEAVVDNIQRMQENMKNQQRGVFTFTAVDGNDLVLSYNPLESYDWVLLTLVPADLISHGTDQYIDQSFMIVAGLILLFVLIIVAFIRINRNHYKQLERVAFVDRVTGGMNNTAFQIQCRELLLKSPPSTYAVGLLNIKNFKLINENFGSVEGNNTLCHIMRVLEKSISQGELAARADADNFFVCLKEHEPEIIRQRLTKMVEDINDFHRNMEEPYRLIIQQGVYIAEEIELEITVMQDRAKTACRNRTPYEDELCIFYSSEFTRQLQMEHELSDLFDNSIKNKDFQVYLQPKICLPTEKIGGAEALIRWVHPQRGMIYPSDFIPLFEKNGKICKLDFYVFEEVCKTLNGWMNKGMELFPVSVNLSRQHFKRPECLLPFQKIAQQYGIPRNIIELELTESIFFDDQGIESVKKQIDSMHEMGFLCSLDDFGAGYSSLGLLMEFEVDVIKLDRRFFLNVAKDKTKDVVASVIALAKKIGADIVAEGIETSEQLEFLRSVHCDMVQGYIFSKPQPIPDFEQWMHGWRDRHEEVCRQTVPEPEAEP